MIKKTLVLLFVCALFLGSCGDEGKVNLNYPITTVFKGISKEGQIEVWTKNNGSVVSVPLDQTTLDEHEAFTTIESEGTFTQVIFNSGSQADLFSSGNLFFEGVFQIVYICLDNTLTFPFAIGLTTYEIMANGIPTSFDVVSQATVEDDGNSLITSSIGALRLDKELLKANLAEGATIAIINYTESYGQ